MEKTEKTKEIFRNIHDFSRSSATAAREVRDSFNLLRATIMLSSSFLDAQNVEGDGDAEYWSLTCNFMSHQGEIACVAITDILADCKDSVDSSIQDDLNNVIIVLRKAVNKHKDCVGGTHFWKSTAHKLIETFKQSSGNLKSIAERFEPTTDRDDCVAYISGIASLYQRQKIVNSVKGEQPNWKRHYLLLNHQMMFGTVILKHLLQYSVKEFSGSINEKLFKVWETQMWFLNKKSLYEVNETVNSESWHSISVEICKEMRNTAQTLSEILREI